jgi:hypothetical protein
MTSNYMDREISDEYISDFLEGLDPQKRKCPFPVSLKIPRDFLKEPYAHGVSIVGDSLKNISPPDDVMWKRKSH